MDKTNEYVLKVGGQAAQRLRLLDEIYGPYSQGFLRKIGLPNHFQILEVSCGTGNTSCWIAEQLNGMGRVIGVDISPEQVELAKQQARERNLKNIEFLALSVFDLHTLNIQFDLVYSRFLLVHLSEAESALKKMYDQVKPNGILACDEQSLAAARCFPPSKAFNDSLALTYKIIKNKNLDFDFGMRLFMEFKKLNLNQIQLQTIQPVLLTEQQKKLWLMFYQEAREAFLASGMISEMELNQMIDQLEGIIKNEDYYFLPMQNFQAWGIKQSIN